MTTITAQKANDHQLADSIARWMGLVLGLALIASLLMIIGSAIHIDLPQIGVVGGPLNACSNGTAALNGASAELADGWANCGAPAGVDVNFGQVFIAD